ncbi:MAG: peptide chain release factor N(5)-glutamine methyltransferase [Candidatus Omnitrophota bacterium]|nr:peptide chain release factor N(5)-glutamine methyltransferase [Candidatus Omnitrophota bacterium]
MIKTVEPHTPLQYIMGKEKFFGLDFMVNEHVLIPRPETEVLVDMVIELLRGPQSAVHSPRILDLCTGSGNIAISLMVRLNSPSMPSKAKGRVEALTKTNSCCKMVASDISQNALEIARSNARLNGVSDDISFIKSDLFKDISGEFDFIISNPPYIAWYEFETLQKEVLKEPMLALDGGLDGLDFYRRIFLEAPRYLKHGGYCVVEIGFGQLPAIKDIVEQKSRDSSLRGANEVSDEAISLKAGLLRPSGARNDGIHKRKGFEILKVIPDQYGIDRVVVAQWIN